MSAKHPIIAITGSSGAGTTSVTRTFENIFRREEVVAAIVEGDSFHRYDRAAMKTALAESEAQNRPHFSHFGEDANLFDELEALFASYAESGSGTSRKYLHDEQEAAPFKQPPGTFTPWAPLPPSELLFYEGLHGGVTTDKVDVARLADLLIGVVPVINLEWIQKIHRDKSTRGYSTEAVTDVVRRQGEVGLDVVSDGEMSKTSFLGYTDDRLTGFVSTTAATDPSMALTAAGGAWARRVDSRREWRAFRGQLDHLRHAAFESKLRTKIS